jgi:hypothetical protein
MAGRNGGVWRGIGRLLTWAVGFVVILLAMVLVSALALQHLRTWQAMSTWIAALRPAFIVVHLALLAALWFRWADLVQWGFRKGWVLPAHVRPLLGLRRRVVVMLCLLEVVLVIRPFEWL